MPKSKWSVLNGCPVGTATVKDVPSVKGKAGIGIPNANYQRGVRFERERLKHYREVMKHDVLRTAGSHGTWDLVSIDGARGIVTLIQCKVVSSASTARRLLSNFKAAPPYPPAANVHQVLEVKVTGSTEVHSATV